MITVKRVNLTDVKVNDLSRNASQKEITKKWTEQKTLDTWKASGWSKKIESKRTRANLSDFDRFKVFAAKKAKKAIVSKA